MKPMIAVALAAACNSVAAQWQQMQDFPGTARDDAASFSHYCKVYVGTGMQVGWSLTNDWWRYDVIQWSWQPVASLPATPRQYCTAHMLEDVGYLFGGLDANGPLSELWAYDTGNDNWSQKPSLPGAGRYASTSFVHEGKFHVVGGVVAGGTALNELWEYDPATEQWTQRADLPGAGRHRATAISPGFMLDAPLVVGGATEDFTPLDEVWQYGPVDTWTQRASLPEARYGMSSSGLPDVIVVAGAVSNSTFRGDGYQYNPGSDAWAPWGAAGIPDARRGGAVGWSESCSGWYFTYYGLGLDSTSTRRSDWHETGFAFAIDEHRSLDLPLFPVPATDRIRVGCSIIDGVPDISIIDATGKAVHSAPSLLDPTIDISGLPAGSYTIILRQNDMQRTGRFIKLP